MLGNAIFLLQIREFIKIKNEGRKVKKKTRGAARQMEKVEDGLRKKKKEMQAWEPGEWNNNSHLKLASFFTNFFLCNSVM